MPLSAGPVRSFPDSTHEDVGTIIGLLRSYGASGVLPHEGRGLGRAGAGLRGQKSVALYKRHLGAGSGCPHARVVGRHGWRGRPHRRPAPERPGPGIWTSSALRAHRPPGGPCLPAPEKGSSSPAVTKTFAERIPLPPRRGRRTQPPPLGRASFPRRAPPARSTTQSPPRRGAPPQRGGALRFGVHILPFLGLPSSPSSGLLGWLRRHASLSSSDLRWCSFRRRSASSLSRLSRSSSRRSVTPLLLCLAGRPRPFDGKQLAVGGRAALRLWDHIWTRGRSVVSAWPGSAARRARGRNPKRSGFVPTRACLPVPLRSAHRQVRDQHPSPLLLLAIGWSAARILVPFSGP